MVHPSTRKKQQNRVRIMQAMQDGPLTVVQIRHKTGLGETTVRQHLAELERQKRLGSQPYKALSGKGRAFFLKDPEAS